MNEFGFPPDYWKTITVPEFFAWQGLAGKRAVESGNRARRAEYEQKLKQLPRGGA